MAPERKRKHQLDDRPPQIMLETVAAAFHGGASSGGAAYRHAHQDPLARPGAQTPAVEAALQNRVIRCGSCS